MACGCCTLLSQRDCTATSALNGICFQRTHSVTNVPPDSTVSVTPLATVNGPVTLAFSVARIVVLDVRDCALVRNIPPALKFPLFSAGGTTVLACGAR